MKEEEEDGNCSTVKLDEERKQLLLLLSRGKPLEAIQFSIMP